MSVPLALRLSEATFERCAAEVTKRDGFRHASESWLLAELQIDGVSHRLDLIEVHDVPPYGEQEAVIAELDPDLRFARRIVGRGRLAEVSFNGRRYVAVVVPWGA